jgi:hypothetical protein
MTPSETRRYYQETYENWNVAVLCYIAGNLADDELVVQALSLAVYLQSIQVRRNPDTDRNELVDPN